MAYTANYSAEDADDVVIDIVVTILVAIVGFGTLIGLIWVYGYFKKKIKV